MRLNKNGFVARHALKQNPRLHDECSLFTAFTIAMLKRAFWNILLPVWVIIALFLSIGGTIFDGPAWLVFKSEGQFVTAMIDSVHWTLQIVLFVPAMMITSLTYVLVVIGTVVGVLWGIGKVARLSVSKTAEATPLNVVIAGIKNKWQGVCRPIEFYED